MKNVRLLMGAVLSLSVLVASARADEATAKKYLDEATELVGKNSSQFFDDANSKLDLAEASLDDVAEPAKGQLKKRVDELRNKIKSTAAAEDKDKIDRQIKNLLTELEGVIGNLAAWPGKSEELTTLLNDPKTTAALGQPAVDAYKKQYATLAKVHGTKALKENLATATTQVEQLEKFWTEQKAIITSATESPEAKKQALGHVETELDAMPRYLKDLPADNADVKALNARVKTVQDAYNAAAGAAGAGEVLDRISRYFESYKDEFNGMDAETAVPTWADFKNSANNARDLGAPKTMNYVTRVPTWAKELEESEAFKAVQNDPAVKAKVAEIVSKLTAARAKLKKNAESIVSGFEAEKANPNNVGESIMLGQRIKYALGENDADAKALADRVEKVNQAGRDAANKAEADKDAFYKTMTDQANKAWPAMLGSYTISDGFDPNNPSALKGKFIKITGHNLMGWRFKHGDFPYATRLNGKPVAGNYAPDVKAALKEVEDKIGRSIGDSDEDGEWTAVARVEGNTGRLVELVKSSGNVSAGGETVNVDATNEVPVDAPIVTIVALKAGPVAVAQDQGSVKADGSVSTPVAAGSTAAAKGGRGGFGRFVGLLSGLLAIVVGAACLMKSKFAPLAGNAGAVQLTEKVGNQNLAYLGLAGVSLGAIGLLLNLIGLASHFIAALIGLIASAAMIVAGGVVSRDFLQSRGLLPGSVTAPLGTYAVPAGLACVGLGLLTLVLSLF